MGAIVASRLAASLIPRARHEPLPTRAAAHLRAIDYQTRDAAICCYQRAGWELADDDHSHSRRRAHLHDTPARFLQ